MAQVSNTSTPLVEDATKLDIIVVGHGIAGLVFAINAKVKGHRVRLFEKRPGLDDFGELSHSNRLLSNAKTYKTIARIYVKYCRRILYNKS